MRLVTLILNIVQCKLSLEWYTQNVQLPYRNCLKVKCKINDDDIKIIELEFLLTEICEVCALVPRLPDIVHCWGSPNKQVVTYDTEYSPPCLQ